MKDLNDLSERTLNAIESLVDLLQEVHELIQEGVEEMEKELNE